MKRYKSWMSDIIQDNQSTEIIKLENKHKCVTKPNDDETMKSESS